MENRRVRGLFPCVGGAGLAALFLSACGNQPPVGSDMAGGGAGGVGTIVLSLGSGGNNGSVGGAGGTGSGTVAAAVWPPAGYLNVTHSTIGDYALGPEISGNTGPTATGGSSGDSASGCIGLFGVVRDFKMGNQSGGHPDFETALAGLDTGIVYF